MPEGQELSSEASPRQDFTDAVRPVFFRTELEEFLYATHGGTLFVVEFRGRAYGVTCRHVFGDFEPGRLFVANEKWAQKGSLPAPVVGIYYPSSPIDGATGTDIVDICVIEFAEDLSSDFFKGTAYRIAENSVATSRPGHRLLVAGVLKEKSFIALPDIKIGYSRLEFQDVGPAASDPVLRMAIAEFTNPEFTSITGISGSPVFDVAADALCGMVVRGGMTKSRCQIYFIDIFDIVQLLEAISMRTNRTYYTKTVLRPVATVAKG